MGICVFLKKHGGFIKKFNEEMGLKISTVSKQALDQLLNYQWHGNIRDLQNAIQSSMILAREGILTIEHLPMRLKGYPLLESSTLDISAGLDENIKYICSKLEKELIVEALNQSGYNRTTAASLLKISRKTLFNKMKQYDL